jgi:hypothetical protein
MLVNPITELVKLATNDKARCRAIKMVYTSLEVTHGQHSAALFEAVSCWYAQKLCEHVVVHLHTTGSHFTQHRCDHRMASQLCFVGTDMALCACVYPLCHLEVKYHRH